MATDCHCILRPSLGSHAAWAGWGWWWGPLVSSPLRARLFEGPRLLPTAPTPLLDRPRRARALPGLALALALARGSAADKSARERGCGAPRLPRIQAAADPRPRHSPCRPSLSSCPPRGPPAPFLRTSRTPPPTCTPSFPTTQVGTTRAQAHPRRTAGTGGLLGLGPTPEKSSRHVPGRGSRRPGRTAGFGVSPVSPKLPQQRR